MRANRTSGSMRGRRKRATPLRACALLYALGGHNPAQHLVGDRQILLELEG